MIVKNNITIILSLKILDICLFINFIDLYILIAIMIILLRDQYIFSINFFYFF